MANKTVKTLIKRRPASDTAEPELRPTFPQLLDELRDFTCQRRLHVGLASHELEQLRVDLSLVIDQIAEFVPWGEEAEDDAGEV